MPVHMMEAGPLAACCYIVHAPDAAACAVIDPGGDADLIDGRVRALKLTVEAIFLTHAHGDHIGGLDALRALWPQAEVACSAETSRRMTDPVLNLSSFMGAPFAVAPARRLLADGEKFHLAGLEWQTRIVPGHEPGEMVYITDNGNTVFTGDTVFAGSIGRSDFPGGDAAALTDGLRALLAALPPDAKLYPGHGPDTTASEELAHNPYLRPGLF